MPSPPGPSTAAKAALRALQPRLATALIAIVLVGVSCSPPPEPPPQFGWEAIEARGSIRLARQQWAGFDTLPRQGLGPEHYERIAEQFAERHGLAAEWVVVAGFEDLLASVGNGTADVVVAPVTITEARASRLLFTEPLTHSREWVIGTATDGLFGIPKGRAFAESLARHYPDAEVTLLPDSADPLDVLNRIEQGEIAASIMDEATARRAVHSSDAVKLLQALPETRHLAWALHPDAATLKQRLDAFLAEQHAIDTTHEVRDWNAIKAAGYLRVVTVTGPTTYYLWRGERLGFEQELVELFAKAHGLELEVVVAPSSAHLADWLLEGRGDLISASWFATEDRVGRGLAFSEPYLEVKQTFVTARGPIDSFAQLAGREVVVSGAASQARTLEEMAASTGLQPRLVNRLTSAILGDVARGVYDATLADSHQAELAAQFDERLRLGLQLEPPEGLRWAVLSQHTELRQELDAFLARERRGYDFNVLYGKYFQNERRMRRQHEDRVTGDDLSPFDEVVRSEVQGVADGAFDWRLVVARSAEQHPRWRPLSRMDLEPLPRPRPRPAPLVRARRLQRRRRPRARGTTRGAATEPRRQRLVRQRRTRHAAAGGRTLGQPIHARLRPRRRTGTLRPPNPRPLPRLPRPLPRPGRRPNRLGNTTARPRTGVAAAGNAPCGA